MDKNRDETINVLHPECPRCYRPMCRLHDHDYYCIECAARPIRVSTSDSVKPGELYLTSAPQYIGGFYSNKDMWDKNRFVKVKNMSYSDRSKDLVEQLIEFIEAPEITPGFWTTKDGRKAEVHEFSSKPQKLFFGTIHGEQNGYVFLWDSRGTCLGRRILVGEETKIPLTDGANLVGPWKEKRPVSVWLVLRDDGCVIRTCADKKTAIRVRDELTSSSWICYVSGTEGDEPVDAVPETDL